MKKLIVSFIVLSVVLLADLSVQQIEQMVSKIHEKREGIKLDTLQTTKEPFVRLQKDDNVTKFVVPEKGEDIQFILNAIINGKAYINEQWFSKSERIKGYTIEEIGNNNVTLKNENNVKKLFLYKNRDNIIQLEERK